MEERWFLRNVNVNGPLQALLTWGDSNNFSYVAQFNARLLGFASFSDFVFEHRSFQNLCPICILAQLLDLRLLGIEQGQQP